MPAPPVPTATYEPLDGGATVTAGDVVRGALGFEEEIRRLLRSRLILVHALALAYTMMLGALSWAVAHMDDAALHRPDQGNPWLLALPFGQSCLGLGVLLRAPWMSHRGLRAWELVHFATHAAFYGVLRYGLLSAVGGAAEPSLMLIGMFGGFTLFGTITLVLAYGVLIPNPPRRSLRIVCGLTAVPFFVTALAAIAHPGLRLHFVPLCLQAAANLTFPAAIAVFAAARADALQRRAFDAERRVAEQVGPYTLVQKLGQGGMGEVWLAEHRLLKRPCAVKFIRPEHAANPSAAARFEREVRAVTALSHFHTIRIYDYGRADDGGFYYVMEYLEGPTLESLVQERGPLEPSRAVYLLRQLCGALAEAHAAGLVHRDLKPGNVIVASLGGQRDVAKLLDFGLVHDTGTDADVRLTRTGTVMGTPAYMCPEQAGGEPNIDARGDVYSLGAVAFFALTGRPPFDEPSVGKVLSAHLTRTPQRADDLRHEVPADIADVVARCLEKSPGERFASAAELERALAACACSAGWNPARAAAWWEANSERV